MSLRVLSTVFIIAASILMAIMQGEDGNVSAKVDEQNHLQDRYFEVRRKIDQATTVWELSRLFLSLQDLFAGVGAPEEVRRSNLEHYTYTIGAAETFAFNAAYGDAESEEDLDRAQGPRKRHREERDVEALRAGYRRYVQRAGDKGNEHILKIRDIDSDIRHLRSRKGRCGVVPSSLIS